jgi:DNA replication and repair protein RecF
MLIQRLDITDVRNLRQVNLPELASINVFYGVNGSGKSSVLESVHLLSLAKSFRSHKLNPVINHEAERCVVFGEVLTDQQGSLPIGVQRSKKESGLIKVAGKAVRSLAELAEYVPLQVINSDTFRLLEGSPSVRRQFLDWGVFHVEHQFHEVWKATQRCLKQRNSLLRRDKIDEQQLAVWNIELAKNGQQLDTFRQSYFEQLVPIFQRLLDQLVELEGLQISYYRGWDKEKTLGQVLTDNLSKEREQHRTLTGPHRADLRIRYKGLNAAEMLSRGQQKLVVCALRVAQGYLLSEKAGRRCVYLIDDLPAELDIQHRKSLCQLLEELNCQVFVTCVDHKDLAECWSKERDVNLFHVEHGRIQQAE